MMLAAIAPATRQARSGRRVSTKCAASTIAAEVSSDASACAVRQLSPNPRIQKAFQ
jgi:hypothetical protein